MLVRMSTQGKMGLIAIYSGAAFMIAAIMNPFYQGANVVLLIISAIVLVAGVLLLTRDPYAKSLRWKILWARWGSLKGGIGFGFLTFGLIILSTLAPGDLKADYSTDRWWQYPALGASALVIGVALLLTDRASSRSKL